MKKTLSVVLAVLMLFSTAAFAFSAQKELTEFCINPYGNQKNAPDTIYWQTVNNKTCLFLPSDTVLSDCVIYYTASAPVKCNGVTVENGGKNTVFTKSDTYTLTCGEQTVALQLYISANVPAMYLTTESGSLSYIHADKENKEKGGARVYENGKMTVDAELKQIKGRGNSTWAFDKKPYNIKFEKKTDLFGLGAAKKWSLLASWLDPSQLRNPAGFTLAEKLGLYYSSKYQLVDLYINSQYMGNYLVCESVEVGENRVDIEDLDKANEKANPETELDTLAQVGSGENGAVLPGNAYGSQKWIDIPNDPQNITGGYLLELDINANYSKELCGFVTDCGQTVVIKSPELASKAQVMYISDYFNQATEALFSSTGYNTLGKHYSQYFDMASFVNMYILSEWCMNYDAGMTSVYLFKPADSDLIYFSPAWDMDIAFGQNYSKFGASISDTENWWANRINYNGHNTVFYQAFQHSDFRAAVKERWAQIKGEGLAEKTASAISATAKKWQTSCVLNAIRWNTYNTNDQTAVLAKIQTDDNQVISNIKARAKTLNKGFGEKSAYLYFETGIVDSGDLWAFIVPVAEVGDRISLPYEEKAGWISEPANKVFYGWNTEPDGSGKTYLEGESFKLTKEFQTLYAVWVDADDLDKLNEKQSKGKWIDFINRIKAFFMLIPNLLKKLFG